MLFEEPVLLEGFPLTAAAISPLPAEGDGSSLLAKFC